MNYCPPRKTGADRSSHKQATQDRNHLRYPSPWSPHSPAHPHPPRRRSTVCTCDPGGRLKSNAHRGPACHPAEEPQVRRENHRCVCLAYSGAPLPNGCLTRASPHRLGTRRPQRAASPTPATSRAPAPGNNTRTKSQPVCVRCKINQALSQPNHSNHLRAAHAHAPCASGVVLSAEHVKGDEQATASRRLRGSAG